MSNCRMTVSGTRRSGSALAYFKVLALHWSEWTEQNCRTLVSFNWSLNRDWNYQPVKYEGVMLFITA